MKTAVLSKNRFVFEKRKIPECGLDQVLVKTAGCGILNMDGR